MAENTNESYLVMSMKSPTYDSQFVNINDTIFEPENVAIMLYQYSPLYGLKLAYCCARIAESSGNPATLRFWNEVFNIISSDMQGAIH